MNDTLPFPFPLQLICLYHLRTLSNYSFVSISADVWKSTFLMTRCAAHLSLITDLYIYFRPTAKTTTASDTDVSLVTPGSDYMFLLSSILLFTHRRRIHRNDRDAMQTVYEIPGA